jgi:hypothetical protein
MDRLPYGASCANSLTNQIAHYMRTDHRPGGCAPVAAMLEKRYWRRAQCFKKLRGQ